MTFTQSVGLRIKDKDKLDFRDTIRFLYNGLQREERKPQKKPKYALLTVTIHVTTNRYPPIVIFSKTNIPYAEILKTVQVDLDLEDLSGNQARKGWRNFKRKPS